MTKYFEQIGISNRVPMNGTDKWNLIMTPGLGHRTARYYNFKAQPSMSTDNVVGGTSAGLPSLGDPLVIASLIAGLIGITLSIIIILSIWILQRSKYSAQTQILNLDSCTGILNSNYVEPEVAVSTTEKPPQRLSSFRVKETSV